MSGKPVGSHYQTNGKMHTLMMPESYIQMMLEIRENHVSLWLIVQNKPDISEVLAEVGAYLNLEMDGMYNVPQTCEDFWYKLKQLGSKIILPPSMVSTREH